MATGEHLRRSYEVADPSLSQRGGYGVVFQATLIDDHLGANLRGLTVSLKMLSGVDEDRWAKLVVRSPQLVRFSHPGLARHLEVFDGLPLAGAVLGPEEPTVHWVVNEWVAGSPLADVDVGLDVHAALELFVCAADAVDHLHAAGVAHRDLHPRNLILTANRQLVVIDYDTVLTATSATTTRVLAGTKFTAELPEPAQRDPFLADNVSFARCVVHALAGDGDGALEQEDAVLKALHLARGSLGNTGEFGDLLWSGLAGRMTRCAPWIEDLRAAARTSPRPLTLLGRPARAARLAVSPAPHGLPGAARSHAGNRLPVAAVVLAALMITLVVALQIGGHQGATTPSVASPSTAATPQISASSASATTVQATPSLAASVPPGYTGFTDAVHRFTISIPTGWTQNDPSSPDAVRRIEGLMKRNPRLTSTFQSSDLAREGIRFQAFEENSAAGVNVVVMSAPGVRSTDLPTIFDGARTRYQEEGGTILATGFIQLGGQPAFKAVVDVPWTGLTGQVEILHLVQYSLALNESLYILTLRGVDGELTAIADTLRVS